MQVQLKQSELVSAVQQFVASQGFNLTDKSVTVDFTAGRGENGLSATVTIEQGMALPDLSGDKPALKVMAPAPAPAAEQAANVASAEAAAPAPAEAVAATGKTSLFTS